MSVSNDALTWLDQVLAVPTVGVQIVPNFRMASQLAQSAAPVIDSIFGEEGEINLDAKNPFQLSFRTKTGFSFNLSPTDLVVAFNYAVVSKRRAGSLPAVEEIRIRPYTTILEETGERIRDVLRTLSACHEINAMRIGIVAAARVDKGALPPGVQDLVEDLGKPWGTPVVKANSSLLVNLLENQEATDRCHHTITFDDAREPKEVHVTLDWQRVLNEPKRMAGGDSAAIIVECRKQALAYFQRVGEGL